MEVLEELSSMLVRIVLMVEQIQAQQHNPSDEVELMVR